MADEFTKADLSQNAKINELERRVSALERAPKAQSTSEIERKLGELDPLRTLLEHITQIKRYFGAGG